jgi:hypothetical protein
MNTCFFHRVAHRAVAYIQEEHNMKKINHSIKLDHSQLSSYWAERKDYRYYRKIIEFAKEYAPHAGTVIDVGPRDTPFLDAIDWVPSKTAIDLQCLPSITDAITLQGDFMQFEPERQFDLVFCLQVLEHLTDPKSFARKLLRTGRVVIISVPYNWTEDQCEWHLQDPIDEAKLLSWTEKQWLKKVTVEDNGVERLIAVFEGDG